MFNALLCTFEKLNIGFRDDQVDTVRKRVVDTFSDGCSVVLGSAPTDVQGLGICLGDLFAALSDCLNYQKAHKRRPKAKIVDYDNLNNCTPTTYHANIK